MGDLIPPALGGFIDGHTVQQLVETEVMMTSSGGSGIGDDMDPICELNALIISSFPISTSPSTATGGMMTAV